MILVDASVWIDFLNAKATLQTDALRHLLRLRKHLAIGDLPLIEVLQGARSDRAARDRQDWLSSFTPIDIVGHRVAIEAARNYRELRAKGITVRKTIDALIATRCILDGLPLLYSDRDFDPFVEHLGLRSAMALITGPH
ncbi:PIN domain nuclease [uncultured Sphingomonas sp.]|uniref:type II toxin-antitoxin system VapC family toxin n=1 Tax=uncultured Sphingomonas sp. TaxID=158754 RepID=UPI0035CA9F13